MKGIELSRKYYEEIGLPTLKKLFGDKLNKLAFGLVGHGSECFGFDDEISTDHDYEPGFCIWISEQDEKEFGFRLMRAYSKLPKEYCGYKCIEKSLSGSDCRGVMTIGDFYMQYTGRRGAPESLEDWLYTPSAYLAEATNGVVFNDPSGEFSKIRNEILYGMPEDVRLKKIASCAFKMAQSGQYNYMRCIKHGEIGSARIALNIFVEECSQIVFLLEKKHAPYYKWIFRAMKQLPKYGNIAYKLEKLLILPYDNVSQIELLIEEISADIVRILKYQSISSSSSDFLEAHAYSVNEKIKDHNLRNMSVIL